MERFQQGEEVEDWSDAQWMWHHPPQKIQREVKQKLEREETEGHCWARHQTAAKGQNHRQWSDQRVSHLPPLPKLWRWTGRDQLCQNIHSLSTIFFKYIVNWTYCKENEL